MKTDRLIEALSTNVEPVRRGGVIRPLAGALTVGAVLAFGLMLATVGLDGSGGSRLGFLAVKLAFALSLVITGAVFLIRSAQPGQESRKALRTLLLLLLAIGLACAAGMTLGGPVDWGVVFGPQWMSCLCCIPLFTFIPFTALILALRLSAPTRLRRTGAVAGLVAGSIGTAVYAFHCPLDSLPFIGVWYSLSIALCAGAGALLGPRLLRW